MVRSHVTAHDVQALLLVECIARIVKNNIRVCLYYMLISLFICPICFVFSTQLRFRNKASEIRIPSLEAYKQEVIQYLNLVLSHSPAAAAYWRTELKVK